MRTGSVCTDNVVKWKLRRILSIGWHAASRADNIASGGPWPPRFPVVAGRHHIDGDGPPVRDARAVHNTRNFRRGIAFDDCTSDAGRSGYPRRSGRSMTPPDNRASTGQCDAVPTCLHVPCFQVQLDASRPRRAHRQANACAYHVPDVIEALRTWAGERALADGQLTILAIEPAAGGRQPGQTGQPGGPGHPELRGFAFSTIPLRSVQRRDPDSSIGSRAAASAEPEH